jgi:hypothetical protein
LLAERVAEPIPQTGVNFQHLAVPAEAGGPANAPPVDAADCQASAGLPWLGPESILEDIRRRVERSADRAVLDLWANVAHSPHLAGVMGAALGSFVRDLALVCANEGNYHYALPHEQVVEVVHAAFDQRLREFTHIHWVGGSA